MKIFIAWRWITLPLLPEVVALRLYGNQLAYKNGILKPDLQK